MAAIVVLAPLARADVTSAIGAAEVEAARQRAEARRAATEQRATEDVAAARAAQAAKRERELAADRAVAGEQQRERRNSGWLLIGTGAGLVALGGFFAWRSSVVNDDIRNGGYMYSYEIAARAVDGQKDNALAWTFGIGGALALAIGVPVVVTSSGVAVTGSFK